MIRAEAGAALEANGDREFYMPCALAAEGGGGGGGAAGVEGECGFVPAGAGGGVDCAEGGGRGRWEMGGNNTGACSWEWGVKGATILRSQLLVR